MAKNFFKIEQLPLDQDISFEGGLWRLQSHGINIVLLVIYRPPASTQNQVPPSIFIDRFLDTLQNILITYGNIIIMGDFNLHVNDPSDPDATNLLDAMSALGFKQHVHLATHTSGNTLDLLFTELNSDNTSVQECKIGEFLSDHHIVVGVTKLVKHNTNQSSITIRSESENVLDRMEAIFLKSDLMSISDPQLLAEKLEDVLGNMYNTCVPEKTKRLHNRVKLPWYTKEIHAQKCVVRRCERRWVKYQEQHQWEAYKSERRRYRRMMDLSKAGFLHGEVLKCKGDSKALHNLLHATTITEKSNPLPNLGSDLDTANEFADFFMNKINLIRSSFENSEIREPRVNEAIPRFTKFSPLSESDIKSLITGMKTKSCEADPIPTKYVKSLLHVLLPVLTKLVNSCFSSFFHTNWKSAIVQPLLKKSGAPLICKNYRTVSNLTFISKLVEKAALKQFMDHCIRYDLLPSYQSAYCEGHSCETSVAYVVNKILWAIGKTAINNVCLL